MHNHNMQTLTTITSRDPSGITLLVRDLSRATITPMPRRARPVTETAVTRALDAAVAEYDEVEKLLKEKDAKLKAAIVEAAKEAAQPGSDLTITEIAHRVGWTREYVNRLATEANVKQPRKTRKAADPHAAASDV